MWQWGVMTTVHHPTGVALNVDRCGCAEMGPRTLARVAGLGVGCRANLLYHSQVCGQVQPDISAMFSGMGWFTKPLGDPRLTCLKLTAVYR